VLRTLVRVAVAAGLAATAYVAIPLSPASAAACPTDEGVTVVVDFHELGGGVQTGCIADGGGQAAAALFPAAGFALDYVQRQPGFVCRVDGVPADNPCVNTPPSDAYWALYWSDGESGSWSYSTAGAGALRVPDGGYVGFSWTGSSARSTPGLAPAPRPAAPSPTHAQPQSAQPSPQHTSSPSSAPTTAAAMPSATGGATEDAKAGEKKPRRPKPSASASASAETPSADATGSEVDAVPTSAEPADPDGGVPTWVAPAVIAVLFGAAGAAAVVRRRRGAA
jgi:hypothetical protein